MLVKMFVFVIIIILFISRIKNTKTNLTKEKYKKKIEKEYNKNEKIYSNSELFIKYFAFESTIYALCYGYILFMNYGFFMNLLSLVQIITVFITVFITLNFGISDIFETNNTKVIYRKKYLLFNMILDYIYYPLSIIFLIFH